MTFWRPSLKMPAVISPKWRKLEKYPQLTSRMSYGHAVWLKMIVRTFYICQYIVLDSYLLRYVPKFEISPQKVAFLGFFCYMLSEVFCQLMFKYI